MGRSAKHSRWRLLLTIVLVLTLFASIAGALVHVQQKAQLTANQLRKMQVEADLIGAFLTDAMLRHDYTEGQRLLEDWTAKHSEVVVLYVELDNGRPFFVYRDHGQTGTPFTIVRSFQYRDRALTLTLCHDASELRGAMASLRGGLLLLTVTLIGLSALTLWYVLFRWMLRPMEEEIATRTRDLNAARDTLEQQVAERTASLAAEIDMRWRAETELRKRGMLVEQSPVMIFITDRDGVIEYVNPKFEEVTGYSAAEAVGQTPRLIKSPDTPRAVHEDLWRTILAGQSWRGELKDRRKDGREFWATVAISPIKDADGTITHFGALHEDITERKLAEESMIEARHAAEMANKAKTDLLANMSHELRTPLNAIIGFSQAMTDGLFGPLGNERYGEYAAFIQSSGTHLLDLINDILDVSAVEAGRLTLNEEPVSLADTYDSTARLVMPHAETAGVTLHSTIGRDLPLVEADPRRLKQILLNLLTNAVKFTTEGGRVDCDARIDADGDMVITVRDTGIGMDADGIATAMSKFGQVDSSLSRKHEGTGLGLPLTKGLVELHGGTLDLASTVGEGTTVTVRLPASRVIAPAGTMY